MRKKHDIWCEDTADSIFMEMKQDPQYEGMSDQKLYELAHDMNWDYLSEERRNLDIALDGNILVIADLGLWNGRRQGYRELHSNIVSDILSTLCGGKCHWYSDGFDICCEEEHHDGTNHYIYREIKDEYNIYRLMNRIYEGDKITRNKLNYYTKSLVPAVNAVYGW